MVQRAKTLSARSLVTALVGLLLASAHAAERPHRFGVALPYPVALESEPPTGRLPYFTEDLRLPMVVALDSLGGISDVVADDVESQPFADYVRSILQKASFEPGTFDGVARPMRLPVIVEFRPRVKLPRIGFPVDSLMRVSDYGLYERGLNLNGVEPPRVLRFPSYFFVPNSDPEAPVSCPVVLVKVTLTESGTPVRAEAVVSSAPAFTEQLVSACRFAEYAPARVSGHPIASVGFVLLSLFPTTVYPTKPLDFLRSDKLTLHEERSVQWRIDTLGLLAVPVPVRPLQEVRRLDGPYERYRDTFTVVLTIDTLGVVTPRHQNTTIPSLSRAVFALARYMAFYPALDNQGKPVSFSGLARLEFTGSADVRIHYCWLE